jgi:hypothetical protein
MEGGRMRKLKNKLAWPPNWLPDTILPPGVEPEISMEELLDNSAEENAVLYYRRSGRIRDPHPELFEDAEEVDLYCYIRPLLPGGLLPWENGRGSSLTKSNKSTIVFVDPLDNSKWVKVRPGELRKLTKEEFSALFESNNFAIVMKNPVHR